jgi:23S rRNA (cytidine1920-2'-O)/16S rRNA (cytidine1409-2'-O)-methyltransferase
LSRLDNYLVENGLCESRNKAQTLIKEGLVSVNGEQIIKSSHTLKESDKVAVREHKEYVSRAAFKLDAFLDELGVDVKGMNALDIGASTGGFTQVLLERGANEVTAVDVGREQLHKNLKNDARVRSYEGCDIREFKSDKELDIVVSDVAFRLVKSKIILLFKPQFEVGREAKRDKNGVVTDEKAVLNAMIKFEDACALLRWKLALKSPSKLTGKEGNLEYCYFFEK